MISGLKYYPNFITMQEHDTIWDLIYSNNDWGEQPKRRRVKQYGHIYNYRKQKLEENEYKALPVLIDHYCDRFVKMGIFNEKPDSIIINEYLQNGIRTWSINAHIDSPIIFGPTIACLSIGKKCYIEFASDFTDSADVRTLEVNPLSLYIMEKESRYDWLHRIPDRKFNIDISGNNTRVSITFRTIRKD